MGDVFEYDVFLSHSAKDKDVVRAVAERLKEDGVKVWFDEWEIKAGDHMPAKMEEGLEKCRVLVLCMSANAFGSDWWLDSTLRFRDPLNGSRRFILLQLDGTPILNALQPFLCIDWLSDNRDLQYQRLVEICRSPIIEGTHDGTNLRSTNRLDVKAPILAYAISSDGRRMITSEADGNIIFRDLESGESRDLVYSAESPFPFMAWSEDERRAIISKNENDVRLLDVYTGEIIVQFGKNRLQKKQMECFRFMAGGQSTQEIERILSRHHLTIWERIRGLKDKLGSRTPTDVRTIAATFYGAGARKPSALQRSDFRWIPAIAWTIERERALSGRHDQEKIFRLCTDFETVSPGWYGNNAPNFWSMTWSANRRTIFSGCWDGSIRKWNSTDGKCLLIFEGHTAEVKCVALSKDERFLLSASKDGSIRLWDVETGVCKFISTSHLNSTVYVRWGEKFGSAFSGDVNGFVMSWDFSEYINDLVAKQINPELQKSFVPPQVRYTNAKVLLVGDTHSGKTGLAHRLATGQWKPSDGSTVGAWSTQWKLKNNDGTAGIEQEIWLWDFGGQADQRLIHQLYMDRAAVIVLLFDGGQEEVLSGLRDWRMALRRCVRGEVPQLLVAGRIDAGFKASRGKLQHFAKEETLGYFETSAQTGEGCDQLHAAIMKRIEWDNIPITTTVGLFKAIKDEILKLRDEGQVLHTFKELRDLLWRRMPEKMRFTDETLHAVIGLLDGPGAVKELDYGTYILLQPEWVNAYGQAVIRTLRSDPKELGCLPLGSIAEGKLVYQSVGRDGAPVEMKRLKEVEERIVLGEMERQLMERGLCLRQGDKLVFPSHCGRDRPKVVEHPSVFVSYGVSGYLDDMYATLVVKLAGSEAFHLKELWRDAADFDTLEGEHRMGVKLMRESESSGEISVYFGPGVTQEEQVIFANYIHAHLAGKSEEVRRWRHYVCPKCHTAKGNPQVLMEKLIEKREDADTECDKCGKRFGLWDALEKKFASEKVRQAVENLKAEDLVRLDSRRKGKLLALEVGARITSADQKCFEIPGTEDEGLDMELEFTEEGKGTGKRLYLQLKAGDSHLTQRKDGVEIFKIKKQRWVKYWLKQPMPVMLVIGTFDEVPWTDKLEFRDVRWMEISSVLKAASEGGKKAVRQIEFKGERLDMTSLHRWRERAMAAAAGKK